MTNLTMQACEFGGELYERFGRMGSQIHEVPYPLHGETIDVGCCRRMLPPPLPLLSVAAAQTVTGNKSE